MQKFIYYIFIFFVKLISIFSYKTLYKLSNIFSFFLYYFIEYRKEVVLKNLKNSFPEKDEKEIKEIAKKTYQNLSDIFLETIKNFNAPIEELKKRFILENPEFLEDLYKKNKNLIAVLGHYGNWELGAQVAGLYTEYNVYGLYKPIKNIYIDEYLKKTRGKGSKLVSIYETKKTFLETRKKKSLFLLIADQSPSSMKKAHWVDFLNQKTACLHGAENYARVFDYPVIFIKVSREKRGFYKAKLSMLVNEPKKIENTGDITKKFMNTLETQIREKPENWLWTHKRWKKKN